MFHGERWAAVFVAALGDSAEAGLLRMRALIPPLRAIPSALSGYPAARRVEKLLRESAGQTARMTACADCGATAGANAAGTSAAAPSMEAAAEFVTRFIALLVERRRFRHADSIMEKIEARIDARSGALAVTLESAAAPDGGCACGADIEEFKRRIAEITGASKVKLRARPAPELLGGYRLQIGGFYVDASLKRQLEKMKADLEAAALRCGSELQRADF